MLVSFCHHTPRTRTHTHTHTHTCTPGVSICQALASDEEDEEDYGSSSGHRVGGAPLPPVVSDPSELSSVLMKALRVRKEEEGE